MRGREPKPWPRAWAEPHGAELAGVFVYPGPRPSTDPRDFRRVHQRLDLPPHQGGEAQGESIGDLVGQPVERVRREPVGLSVGVARADASAPRGRPSANGVIPECRIQSCQVLDHVERCQLGHDLDREGCCTG